MSDLTPGTGDPTQQAVDLPVFTRKATGLVREVSLIQQMVFNASAANTIGVSLIFALFSVLFFPRANPYIAIIASIVIGLFIWTTFALLSATIPRIGGDYTFNSRMIHPAIGLGGNALAFISSLLAVGVWGYWMATQGFSPVFTVIGSVTGSSRMTSWGNYFSPTHKWVVFITAVLAILVCSVLAALGTRLIVRVMTVLFAIAAVGFIIDFGILLFTSHGSFMNTVDNVAGRGTYHKTVAAGANSGLYPDHGYSTKNTIGAIYTAVTALLWVYWGTYLSAEFKGGGQRKRQLTAMVGTGVIQGIVVLIAAVIFLHTVGYNFFVSALAGNYTAPGGATVGTAGYVYFASLVAKNSVVVSLLALTFLGWWLPGQYINAAMMQRALLTWSFDGVAPRVFGDVSERRHTPIKAIAFTFLLSVPIAAWVSFSTNFFAALSVSALYNFFPIALVGISAMLIARRRPELYRGSAGDWRIGGVGILPIAGLGTVISAVFLIGLALYFHTNIGLSDSTALLGLSYYQLSWITPILVFVISAGWYFGVRAFRQGEGVDIELAYRTIPPD